MRAQQTRKPAKSAGSILGPDPMYRRVQIDLATRIKTGDLREGESLPSEDALCKLYGVSRITVRRALDGLRAEHYVATRNGAGSFVTRPPRVFHGALVDVLSGSWDTRQFISERWSLPPQIVQDELKLTADQKVKIWESVLIDQDRPIVHSRTYMPRPMAERVEREHIEHYRSITRAIEEQLDEKVTRAIQTIEAQIATARVAKLLHVAERSAVLRIHRTYYGRAGKPLHVTIVHGHPELYRYTVELVAR